MLTVAWAGARHGATSWSDIFASAPAQPSNESIARTMWRNLVILALIIYCALIAGILFLLWR
jgi:hypothetical protein